jgi:Flp pilus assembly protein TadD
MLPPLDLPPWTRRWLLGLILVGATICAYQPAWRAGFIWDDDRYVTNNPLLTAPDGLQRIWFSTDSPSQYFPLVYTTFRFEHALWGLNPAGYHWVNLLLHAVNALLVWRLLQRLAVPGAWLAAAIFALHPVNVESVAWVTELKNVQSLFFILLALLAWVRFLASEESRELRAESLEHELSGTSEGSALSSQLVALGSQRPWGWYALALFFYLLALFSKTTACTLPAALLLILWLKRKPIGCARLAQMIPFLGLGFAMGLVTMWWERHHQGTAGSDFGLGPLERVLIASRAAWFYGAKLLWPVDLTFIYPLWKIDATSRIAYLWLGATAGLSAVIYWARRFVGRSVEVATVYYLATLTPMLGFVMLYTFHFSFVADHYQYVASLGPIALAAAGLSAWSWWGQRTPWLKPLLSGVLLTTLGVLTWRQCGMYSDLETLWQTTLARNPQSYIAHNSLSLIRLQQGRVDDAIAHARKALELQSNAPDHALALINLGNATLQKGQIDDAIEDFTKALAIQPDFADPHNNLGSALLQKGRVDEAMAHFDKALTLQPHHANAHYNLGNAFLEKGRLDDAGAHYRSALETAPDDADTHLNFGTALLLQNRLDEALIQFQEALRIQPTSIPARNNLGFILLRSGRPQEAAAQYQIALELQPDNASTLSNLAWLLATCAEPTMRNGDQAVELAQHANQLSGGENPIVLRTLAAAVAEIGRFPDAQKYLLKAIELARSAGRQEMVDQLTGELKLYQASRSFHQENK